MNQLLDAHHSVRCLPWQGLVDEIVRLLEGEPVQVPPRLVQALPGGGSLFIMPAVDDRVAITKLITYTPANSAKGVAAIQGDVVVFDNATGRRSLLIDGPTLTARRTAAVSALAALRLAPNTNGPMLVVGAGVQGKAHLEAFAALLGVTKFVIASRSPASTLSLAAHANAMGMHAQMVTDADAAMAHCPLVVTCTPAGAVVLRTPPRSDSFIAAVGAFTPAMRELDTALCRHIAANGSIVLDSAEARHEAGDLLQAGLDISHCATLAEVVRQPMPKPQGPVLFKSCGWAGWDLAAARTALRFLRSDWAV